MMSGKNSSRQVIEAILAGPAQISMSVPLTIVMAVADHSCATAVQADLKDPLILYDGKGFSDHTRLL